MVLGWSLAHEVVWGTRREVECGSGAGYAWGHMAGAVVDLPLGLLGIQVFLLPFEQLGHKYPTLSLFIPAKSCP